MQLRAGDAAYRVERRDVLARGPGFELPRRDLPIARAILSHRTKHNPRSSSTAENLAEQGKPHAQNVLKRILVLEIEAGYLKIEFYTEF